MIESFGKMIAKRVGKDLMLYDPDRDEVHVLNPTAQLVLDLCREGRTGPQIEQAVADHFPMEGKENIFEDVRECIEMLKEKGLVEPMGK